MKVFDWIKGLAGENPESSGADYEGHNSRFYTKVDLGLTYLHQTGAHYQPIIALNKGVPVDPQR